MSDIADGKIETRNVCSILITNYTYTGVIFNFCPMGPGPFCPNSTRSMGHQTTSVGAKSKFHWAKIYGEKGISWKSMHHAESIGPCYGEGKSMRQIDSQCIYSAWHSPKITPDDAPNFFLKHFLDHLHITCHLLCRGVVGV